MRRLDRSLGQPFQTKGQKFAGKMSGGTDFSGEAGGM